MWTTKQEWKDYIEKRFGKEEKVIIPEYDEDGRDIKCWYCNSRDCDAVVDGRYYHKECE